MLLGEGVYAAGLMLWGEGVDSKRYDSIWEWS